MMDSFLGKNNYECRDSGKSKLSSSHCSLTSTCVCYIHACSQPYAHTDT